MISRSSLVCRACGNTFSCSNRKGRFPHRCEPCRGKHERTKTLSLRQQHYMVGALLRRPRACSSCRLEFQPASFGPIPNMCPVCRSSKYRELTKAWNTNHPDSVRESSRRQKQVRRVRIKSLPRENFRDREIFDRDGWICGICKEPVDRLLRHPDPFSVSLDHVIPLCAPQSPGHIRSNVQCSHLYCNIVVKHARF